jgi:hypothetical protein
MPGQNPAEAEGGGANSPLPGGSAFSSHPLTKNQEKKMSLNEGGEGGGENVHSSSPAAEFQAQKAAKCPPHPSLNQMKQHPAPQSVPKQNPLFGFFNNTYKTTSVNGGLIIKIYDRRRMEKDVTFPSSLFHLPELTTRRGQNHLLPTIPL